MIQPPKYRNQLLAAMDLDDLALLEPHLEAIPLKLRDNIEAVNSPIEHIYFVEDGICSIVAHMPRGRDIEVGIVGRDGMTGTAIVEGDTQSPLHTFVQIDGSAFRIKVGDFREALRRSPDLHEFLQLYTRCLAIQISYTALANGRSTIEERLARWLLMIDDRVDGGRFMCTHEFLAIMLGVRRPGVTVALHMLESKGCIRSNRGQVVLLDREGLIKATDGAYGGPEREYQRIIMRVQAPPVDISTQARSERPN
jgi:CRP-like cAMP-binding protein